MFHELGQAFDDEVSTRLSGKNPSTAWNVYSTQDHATPNYVRNTSLWCADVDLTALSPWNSTGEFQRAGTLISPLHCVYAAHFSIAHGSTIRFVASDGTVHTRTIVTSHILTDPYSGTASDIEIGTLNSSLPAAITPILLMPTSVVAKYRSPDEAACRVAGTDQEEKALVFRITVGQQGENPTNALMGWNNPDSTWGETIIGGDSGNPMFAILGGKAVLWSHERSSGVGPHYPSFADAIQAVVEADGQSVTFADLSSYPDIY